MKYRILVALAGLALFVGSPQVSFAQHELQGVVRDSAGSPVPFAIVSLQKGKHVQTTTAEGRFSFDRIAAGQVQLDVSSAGHQPFSILVQLPQQQEISVTLTQAARQLDEVVVAATRVNEASGMAYSNLSRAEIERKNLGQDAPFLLNQVPNVVVNSDAGNGVGYTGIRIRGTDATRINVTINGVPVNDAESQGTFWVNMPDLVSSVNSIQVQRGVGTSVNGAGAFGASINLETNKLDRNPYAELSTSGGSFNTLRTTVAAGTGLMNDRFSLEARASRISSDGYIDRAFSNLNSYFLSASYTTAKTLFKLINFYGREKTYQAWNLVSEDNLRQGRRTFNELGLFVDEYGRERAYDNQVDNYTQNNYQLVVVREITRKVQLNVTGHYTRGFGYYEEYRQDEDPAAYNLQMPLLVTGDSAQVATTDLIRQRWLDNHFGGGIFNLYYRHSARMDLNFGGGYNSYFGKHFGEVVWARYAGLAEKDHRYYFNTANKNDGNLYLKTGWKLLQNLRIFTDLQLRRVEHSFYGPSPGGSVTQQLRRYTFFNPKLGLSYDLGKHLNLYASAAVANKEPNRNDFIENRPENQPLHEELLDLEAGLKFRRGRWQVTANHYNMNYRNQLVLNGEINDVGASKRVNVPLSFRRGVEVEARYDFAKYVAVAANLCWSRNRILDFDEYADQYAEDFSYLGNVRLRTLGSTDISFSPGIVSSAELVVRPLSRLEIAVIHKYVGRQYLDNTSEMSRSIDPYSVLDLRLNYSFESAPRVSLTFAVFNVLNEMYETNGYTYNYFVGSERFVYNYYAPAAPLNMLGGLSVKF